MRTQELIGQIMQKVSEEVNISHYHGRIEFDNEPIVAIRYMMVLILLVLLCFFATSILMYKNMKRTFFISLIVNMVCISVCLSMSYLYLQQQRERKERKDILLNYSVTSTIQQLEILKFNCVDYGGRVALKASEIEDNSKTANLNEIGEIQKSISEDLIKIQKKDGFLNDEISAEIFRQTCGMISMNYIHFTIKERFKIYLGVYIPSNYEEKLIEWYSNQEKLIKELTYWP